MKKRDKVKQGKLQKRTTKRAEYEKSRKLKRKAQAANLAKTNEAAASN